MPTHTAVLNAPREDEGYFGPDSVSWRVFADPSSKLGGMAALLMQALNPNMMRLFSKVSAAYADSAGRDERTGRYLDTLIFGDRAHADAAAQSVRRMHAHAIWEDPKTGEVLRADEPAWLAWTHNALVFGLLRGAETFGLDLTPQEQDRFVVEQLKAGELMGIDPATLPATKDALYAYVEDQRDWLTLGVDAAEVTHALRKPNFRGNPVTVFTTIVVTDGMLSLLPDWARLLYGIEGRPMNLRAAASTTKKMIARARKSTSLHDAIAAVTTRIDEHPYRKVRARR